MIVITNKYFNVYEEVVIGVRYDISEGGRATGETHLWPRTMVAPQCNHGVVAHPQGIQGCE